MKHSLSLRLLLLLVPTLLLSNACASPGETRAPLTTTEPATAIPTQPKPGSWAGENPNISFEVTPEGKVRGFHVTVPFQTGTCRVTLSDDQVIDQDRAFSVTATAPDLGNVLVHRIMAQFDSATSVTGSFEVQICQNVLSSPASKGTWRASWKEPLVSSAVSAATLAPSRIPTRVPTPTTVPTPRSVPGIDTPVTVDGLELQLTLATLQDTYDFFGQPQKPSDPVKNTVLAVEGKPVSGDAGKVPQWKEKVYVTAEDGSNYKPSISASGEINGKPKIVWLFVVPKAAHSFTLFLPGDIAIDLSPLLGNAVKSTETSPNTQVATNPAPTIAQPPTAKPPAPTVAMPPTASSQELPPPVKSFDCSAPRVNDFSRASGFATGQASFARWDNLAGEYQMEMTQPQSYAVQSDGLQSGDAVYEVDVRGANTTNGAYGLVFGINSLSNGQQYYALVVTPNGYYGLFRHTDSGDWIQLKDWTLTPFLYTGTQSNHLKVVRQGPLIALYANGFPLLTTLYDPTYSGNRYAGLIAWSTEAAGVDARFDNYSVCVLDQPYAMPVNPFIKKSIRISPAQPIVLNWTWLTKTKALAQSFASRASTRLSIDGKTWNGLEEYWSQAKAYPNGYAAEWNFPLSLEPGTHRIEIGISLPAPMSDGFDENNDGTPDSYGPGEFLTGWVEVNVE